MKRAFCSFVLFVLLWGSLSANISFKGYFPGITDWGGEMQEAPKLYKPGGTLMAQLRYIHKDRDKWVIVTYSMGSVLLDKPALPVGHRTAYGNIMILEVKRVQGFIMYYTYKPSEKKGNIAVYIPADSRQKVTGNITFSFHNVTQQAADAFMRHFNLRKIKRRMEDLK